MINNSRMGELRISVLTPVRNGSKYLEELIESVRRQTYDNYEHVIIDDGSTDDGATTSILAKYPHLKWTSRSNCGQLRTQNELIEIASGDVISIICADDLYTSNDVLSSIAERFLNQPELDVVVGKTRRLTEKEGSWYTFRPEPPAWIAKRLVRYSLQRAHCALFVRKQLLQEHNLYFDPDYRMRGDWDWMIRLLEANPTVAYVDQTYADYRQHATQTTKVCDVGDFETRRLCARHGINYRLHRIVHGAFSRAGMMCAACAMSRQVGTDVTLKALISHLQRLLQFARHPG